MGCALIQKKNADDLDFSSVFYFNVAMSLVLYGIMFAIAPFIAKFYNIPHLTPIIRVTSLMFIFSGIRNIQQSYVSKNLIFRKFFLNNWLYHRFCDYWNLYGLYGLWSLGLVGQQLANAALGILILWGTVPWRPKLIFSLKRLKRLFDFGWKMLLSSLLNVGYTQLRHLIIGKMYTAKDLAFYDRGHTFPNIIATNLNASIDSVLLPAISAEQDDKNRVRAMTRRAISISTYVMMPMMMGLAVCAEPIV